MVETEPTTGAPVDAVPNRVPIRQNRRGRLKDAADDDAFWLPIEEVHWDGTPIRPDPPSRATDPGTGNRRGTQSRVRRAPRPPDPLPGLSAVLVLSLLTAFFAWVTAGPLWIAVGHATTGTVVIGECTGGGLTQRCRGTFVADRSRFVAHGVRVTGVSTEHTATGTELTARMTGPGGETAYVGTGVVTHLRWLLGLAAVGACAVGIARYGGATRLTDGKMRRWAIAASLGGPLLITLGFLVTAI
ncbi:hypothetical protein ABT336_08460 [Micromonospora sp. NPDC000207]|uniref:hypothetical protein n=1 Tax=Micromonospora sp. NPDC000207 TaxID=3154246 RepID=UPI0033329058